MAENTSSSELFKTYLIRRTTKVWQPTCQWDGAFWQGIEALNVALFMGEKPEHFPNVSAKVSYDDSGLYVIFRVDDHYVRAVAKQYHNPVCRDSCVEFFFTPGEDISEGYFNAEINCGGTMLCRHQIRFGQGGVLLEPGDCEAFGIVSTQPKIVEPEVVKPQTWLIEYRVPYSVLKKYAPVCQPERGVVWRGNFYKCGDQTSHPHWLTWSRIDHPTPKFHLPEYFGKLIFE